MSVEIQCFLQTSERGECRATCWATQKVEGRHSWLRATRDLLLPKHGRANENTWLTSHRACDNNKEIERFRQTEKYNDLGD
jgi:hypothetical protein